MTQDEPEIGYLNQVFWWLERRNDTTFDFTQPYIKKSVKYVYPIFVFLYSVVGLVGMIGNITMLVIMGKRGLYHNPTFFFLGNMAFSDLIKCIFALPISLANMLVQNWIFGSFMCFFLPMIQFFPIHASMLNFLMIAIDRYRLIVHPFKSRIPTGLCAIATWVGAICVVLPHAVYVRYIDLGALLGNNFTGTGICFVNMEKQIQEYFRAMFVALYALPLTIIAFLFVKISAELKSKVIPPTEVHFNNRHINNESHCDPNNDDNTPKVTWANTSDDHRSDSISARHTCRDDLTHVSDDDIDSEKEKRSQKYLITMVTLFAMCWCPINILILVHYFIHERDDISGHFDITFMTFAWFGYLSTCVNPVMFASWCMSASTKDRLKVYFRLNNRRRRSSQVTCPTF